MKYKYLTRPGALHEATPALEAPGPTVSASMIVPQALVERIPESVARENLIFPISSDGDTINCFAVDAANVMLADKLRFILNRNVNLVPASRQTILTLIERHYGSSETESVDSMLAEFTDTAVDFTASGSHYLSSAPQAPAVRRLDNVIVRYKKGRAGIEDEPHRPSGRGVDTTRNLGGSGVFFYVVEEGQRVLMRRHDGTMDVLVGPKRVWIGRKTFKPMSHHIAHPGEFLIVRYRDGRQEHLPGPADVWLDPRVHQSVTQEEALQISAKEAIVVYSKAEGDAIARRVVHGPCLFMPRPGEWLHTFSWHGSKGGHKGVQKEPNSLVFQKLWMMPDQMYHDVSDVRTADNALLTIRLMLFFELLDIEKMLDTTHDPIGDFVNAATSDVIDYVGHYDFENLKRNTAALNELETYRQLSSRAAQCGYRITKVVYRGYGAPDALQQMHDQAIEARTKLQLERATEEQTQDLEDYKLDSQIARAGKRRTEQSTEVTHDLELTRQRQEAELRQREALQLSAREQKRLEAELQVQIQARQQTTLREHLTSLREMGVDLTAYLTQNRADRVIELRGCGATPHLHLDKENNDGQ